MFDALSDRFDGIFKKLRSRGRLTDKEIDEVARELRVALLEADVNVGVARDVHRAREGARARCRGVEEPEPGPAGHQDRATRSSSTPSAAPRASSRSRRSRRRVVMMAGLQGSGKTTASAKLAAPPREPGPPTAARGRRPAATGRGRAAPGARANGSSVPVYSDASRPGRGRARAASTKRRASVATSSSSTPRAGCRSTPI